MSLTLYPFLQSTFCRMSAKIPLAFLAVCGFTVDDDVSNLTDKVVRSRPFSCREDPFSTTFQLQLRFGKDAVGWLGAYMIPVSRAVVFTSIKLTLSETNIKTMKVKGSIVRQQVKLNGGHGWTSYYPIPADGRVKWRFVAEVEYEDVVPKTSPVVWQFNGPTLRMHKDYLQLLETGTGADVTFFIQNETIKAHKGILSIRSSYFGNMFESQMQENATNEIRVMDGTPEAFRGMLQFIYAGLPPHSLDDIAMDLFTLSDKYGLEDLKEVCESNILANLNVNNVVDALLLAKLHDKADLMARAKGVFRGCVDDVLLIEENCEKLKENPDLMLDLIGHYCNV